MQKTYYLCHNCLRVGSTYTSKKDKRERSLCSRCLEKYENDAITLLEQFPYQHKAEEAIYNHLKAKLGL